MLAAYTLHQRLGAGAFGVVYAAVQRDTHTPVAVKLEPWDAASDNDDSDADADADTAPRTQLEYEYRVLRELGDARVARVPTAFAFGRRVPVALPDKPAAPRTLYSVLIMQRLGSSVEAFRMQHESGCLPLRLVAHIAREVLQCLRALHARDFAHRDIKPENLLFDANFCAAAPYTSRVNVIDFGLCKRVYDDRVRKHILLTTGRSLLGTPRYVSLHAHRGWALSRRDDIESLAYVLVYLARGVLPWQGCLSAEECDADGIRDIGQIKSDTPPAVLCAGLPDAFRRTLEHARALDFEAMPDFEFLQALWAEPR